jgi:regulatory protein
VHIGDILTAGKLVSLLEWDQYPRLRQKMIDLLARRPHSRLELKQKALKTGFKTEVADDVINALADSGYVNDAGFAKALARDKFKHNKWGPNRIRAALKTKGITDRLIDEALETISDSADQEHQMRKLLEKQQVKYKNEPNILKRRKKAYDFLIRKGYRHSDVMKIIEQEIY